MVLFDTNEVCVVSSGVHKEGVVLSHAIPNNNLTSLMHFCDALKLPPLNHYLSCQLLKFNKLCKRDVCKSNIEYNKTIILFFEMGASQYKAKFFFSSDNLSLALLNQYRRFKRFTKKCCY